MTEQLCPTENLSNCFVIGAWQMQALHRTNMDASQMQPNCLYKAVITNTSRPLSICSNVFYYKQPRSTDDTCFWC